MSNCSTVASRAVATWMASFGSTPWFQTSSRACSAIGRSTVVTHPLVPRESKRWSDLYRRRGSVERAFGRLKNEAGLAPLRVRGIEKVALHADLCILATLASALARARREPFPSRRRPLVPSIRRAGAVSPCPRSAFRPTLTRGRAQTAEARARMCQHRPRWIVSLAVSLTPPSKRDSGRPIWARNLIRA